MHDEAYEISHIYTLFKINKFWKEHLLLLFCVGWNLWSRLTKCNTFSMKKKAFRYFDTFSGSSLSMYVILEKKRMATNVIYCRGISQNRMFRRRVCLSLSGSSFFSLLKHFQQYITCWRLLCFAFTFCWLRFVFIFVSECLFKSFISSVIPYCLWNDFCHQKTCVFDLTGLILWKGLFIFISGNYLQQSFFLNVKNKNRT